MKLIMLEDVMKASKNDINNIIRKLYFGEFVACHCVRIELLSKKISVKQKNLLDNIKWQIC